MIYVIENLRAVKSQLTKALSRTPINKRRRSAPINNLERMHEAANDTVSETRHGATQVARNARISRSCR